MAKFWRFLFIRFVKYVVDAYDSAGGGLKYIMIE